MSLAGLMNQTITLAHRTGSDLHGKPVYGQATNYACRFRAMNRLQMNKEGNEELLDATALIDGAVTVSLDDQVNYQNVLYKVAHVRTAVNGNGKTHHYTLGLKRWQN